MFKKTIIVTLAFLNFSLPAIAEREDMQIAQKKQLLQYISNEETALKAEIASYEGLSNMLKNVRKDGKIYYIIFTSSILSTLSIGTVVGGYGAYVANGGAVKPAKLVFKIAGALIPIL